MTAITIAGRVAAMAAASAGQPPGQVMGVFARKQAELTTRGIPEEIIAAGALLPGADLLDPFGAPVSLHSAVGNQVARVVGVLSASSTQARAAQLRLGLDLTTVNADGTAGVPMPATIITDADHVVRWVDVHRDSTTPSGAWQILAALDGASR
jgi:hypothetical protein